MLKDIIYGNEQNNKTDQTLSVCAI